jgi:hypothetical protein
MNRMHKSSDHSAYINMTTGKCRARRLRHTQFQVARAARYSQDVTVRVESRYNAGYEETTPIHSLYSICSPRIHVVHVQVVALAAHTYMAYLHGIPTDTQLQAKALHKVLH